MSLMERRLQILLDNERYERISNEAERSGRSVASVIREAIDLCFPTGDTARIASAGSLLSLTAEPAPGRGEGPDELKKLYEDELDRNLLPS